MRIYENDKGEKFVETGVVFQAHENVKEGTDYLWKSRVYHNGPGAHYAVYDMPCAEVRPATPEEVAESEGKKMCPAGCGSEYGARRHEDLISNPCPWVRAGHCHARRYLGSRTEESECYADAHWREFAKPEKKDEQEKQARAADAASDNGIGSRSPEMARKTPVSTATTSKEGTGQASNRSGAEQPAAPPAILPDWTDADCLAFRLKDEWLRFNSSEDWSHLRELIVLRMAVIENEKRAKPRPRPDTRPDKPQPDARSDEFVARRDWGMADK